MSHIDVHEIKLNLRYPNSRQEDITDAFMRGYQGAVQIGNDAVRRVKAEKAALERRIDELCAEVEAEKQRNAKLFEAAEKWMAKAAHYEAENTKLRELCAELLKMAERHDPEWLHWPEMHDELQKLGVKIVKL